MLQAKLADLLGGRAQEDQTGRVAGADEAGVFRQEAVAGVNRPGAALLRNGDELVDVQIGLAGAAFTQRIGFVGLVHVGRIAVGVGVYHDALDAEGVQRSQDTRGNGPAIGNQYLGQ